MKFRILPSKLFLRQLKGLDKKSKDIINSKIDLIEENPYRFKSLHSRKFRRMFRVRFTIKRKETRMVYIVISPDIIILCLLERKKGYKDLDKYLKEIK